MKDSGKLVMAQNCPDYVRRDRFWHSRVAEVIGSDAASILARITATDDFCPLELAVIWRLGLH